MKKTVMMILAITIAITASAGTIYNTNIVAPIIWGSGNVNGGFAVNTTAVQGGTLELGLRTDTRFIGIAPRDNSGNYFPSLGPTTVPGKTGSSWGVPFSIAAPNVLAYSYVLSFTNTVTNATFGFNPLLLPDNAVSGLSVVQNSQAPSFSYIAIPLSFDVNSMDPIRVTLSATPIIGGDSSSVSILVNPGGSEVPEPTTFVLLGTSIIGLGFIKKRNR